MTISTIKAVVNHTIALFFITKSEIVWSKNEKRTIHKNVDLQE
jgi:hypothetical protein